MGRGYGNGFWWGPSSSVEAYDDYGGTIPSSVNVFDEINDISVDKMSHGAFNFNGTHKYQKIYDSTEDSQIQQIEIIPGWNWISFYLESDNMTLNDITMKGFQEHCQEHCQEN